jgi:dihydropteroate synthase
MGILNVTPDSFSGDGLMQTEDTAAQWTERAVARAETLLAAGADILDLGGESTRPGATPVDAETELERILPVIRALRARGASLSVDTTKARVADAALNAGAAMVNDVTGLRGDADMARVIAAYNAAVVLMHNGKQDAGARDFLSAMLDDLRAQMDAALDAGIDAARILIDPGLGFGKTTAQNLEILNRLGEFRVLGCPLLIGPSRKGFISKATGVAVDERDAGTAAAVALGIARGANLVRVHDVERMARTAKMADAILQT